MMRSMTMQGIYKEARSIDAQRKKQYWQMLKRMHGGTDEAVEHIKRTGDDGIWHGTRKELIPQIEEEGLKVGPFREFGKGTFFGDKYTADLYSVDEVLTNSGIKAGNIWTDGRSITDPKEMAEWVKNNPSKGYRVSEGDSVRLAKPSELQGTKLRYPSVQGLKVFDVNERQTLNQVAPSQTAYMNTHDDGIKRLMNMQQERIRNLPIEESRKEIEKVVRQDIESAAIYKNRSMDEINEMVKDETNYILETLAKGNERELKRITRFYKERLGEEQAKKLYTPRNEDELNQLKYYGKLRGRRVFDRLGVGERREMFFDKQDIPPELLRRADGTPMSNGQKEQLVARNLPPKITPSLVGGGQKEQLVERNLPPKITPSLVGGGQKEQLVERNLQEQVLDQSHAYVPTISERIGQLGTTLGLGAVLGKLNNRKDEE